MSDLPPDQFLPLGLAHVERLRDRLNKRDDNYVYDSTGRKIMYFHTPEHVEMCVRDWHDKIGVEHFYNIGNLCCGDWICLHPTGILFVVDHDSLEWWDSAVSFEELLQRLEAHDEKLEKDLYIPKKSA